MIKRSVIKNTAHCWWSADDECYLIESPLFSVAIGTGKTPVAAWLDYDSVLDQFYEELTHGGVGGYDSKGRPAKGGVNLHCQVQPGTKKVLNKLAAEIHCSQGELVDWMTFVLTHQHPPLDYNQQGAKHASYEGNLHAQVRESAIGSPKGQSAEQQLELIKAILLNGLPNSDDYLVKRAKQVTAPARVAKSKTKASKKAPQKAPRI